MDLERIIEKMDSLKGKLDNLRPLREDHLNRLNQKIRLDWNYHSNSIEGNTMSKSETKLLMLGLNTAKGKPFRDYLEMDGHNDALKDLYKIVNKDLKITERLIKKFHKIILVKPYADYDIAEINPGEWKTISNYIIMDNNERLNFSPPEDVAKLMNELINWLNNHISPPKRKKKKYDLHPLLIATGFHLRFIRIHPFGDGNGRMARIMTNLIFMLCGYAPAVVKQEKREYYYTALNISEFDSLENLAIFLGQAVIDTLEMSILAANGESIEEEDDIDKKLKALDHQLKARQMETPLKTEENIRHILDEVVIPFFMFGVEQLSKFDRFFFMKRKGFLVNGGTANMEDDFDTNVFNQISEKEMSGMSLFFLWKELKDTTQKELYTSFRFDIDFSKTTYSISDALINQKYTLKYNQHLTENQQKEWIKNIQNHILNKIKKEVNE